MTTDVVSLHPEDVASSAAELRWVLPDLRLPVGRLLAAPGALGRMLDDGTIVEAWCEPGALRLRLRAGSSWRNCGALVRQALIEAALDLGGWQTDQDDDTVLSVIVEEVLAGPVGDYLRSHGGDLEVREVRDGTVTVALSGACAGCPLASGTLHDRIETAVRERYPDLQEIVAIGVPAGRRVWGIGPRRRAG